MPTILNRYDYLTKFACTEAKEVVRYQFLYRDVFSMPLVYEMMGLWFQNRGYGYQRPYDMQGPKIKEGNRDNIPEDYDFPEIHYTHRQLEIGTEMWIRWRCQRFPPEFNWFGFEIDVDVHVLGLNPAEVVINGKKITADKGEIEVNVTAHLLIDIYKRIANHKILGKFYNFIFNVVYGQKSEEAENFLKREAHLLKKALKEYFKLPTYENHRELTRYWPHKDET